MEDRGRRWNEEQLSRNIVEVKFDFAVMQGLGMDRGGK